jgi:hypothetical protein
VPKNRSRNPRIFNDLEIPGVHILLQAGKMVRDGTPRFRKRIGASSPQGVPAIPQFTNAAT